MYLARQLNSLSFNSWIRCTLLEHPYPEPFRRQARFPSSRAGTLTVFLQVHEEEAAGLRTLRGVIQRDIPIDVLEQHVGPGLPREL